jgi:hypothetical protein
MVRWKNHINKTQKNEKLEIGCLTKSCKNYFILKILHLDIKQKKWWQFCNVYLYNIWYYI